MSKSATRIPFWFRWYGLTIIAGVIVTSHIVYPVVIYYLNRSPDERSSFGDSFGALNSFFSALAFLGVLYAIRLQHQDIQMQREEMQDNAKKLQQQDTERFFFQLLHSLETIIDNTRTKNNSGEVVIGRAAFAHIAEIMRGDFLSAGPQVDLPRKDHVVAIYHQFYDGSKNELGHGRCPAGS